MSSTFFSSVFFPSIFLRPNRLFASGSTVSSEAFLTSETGTLLTFWRIGVTSIVTTPSSSGIASFPSALISVGFSWAVTSAFVSLSFFLKAEILLIIFTLASASGSVKMSESSSNSSSSSKSSSKSSPNSSAKFASSFASTSTTSSPVSTGPNFSSTSFSALIVWASFSRVSGNLSSTDFIAHTKGSALVALSFARSRSSLVGIGIARRLLMK